MLLGDEGRNDEVCVRATFISVLRDNDFLDHDVLARTCPEGTQNRPCSYAHYSGMLTPEITQLNENAIRTVYQCDIMANRIDRMCVPTANKPDTVQRYEQTNCANFMCT